MLSGHSNSAALLQRCALEADFQMCTSKSSLETWQSTKSWVTAWVLSLTISPTVLQSLSLHPKNTSRMDKARGYCYYCWSIRSHIQATAGFNWGKNTSRMDKKAQLLVKWHLVGLWKSYIHHGCPEGCSLELLPGLLSQPCSCLCCLYFWGFFKLHYSSLEGMTTDVGLDRWVLNNWKQDCSHAADPAAPAPAFGGQKQCPCRRSYLRRWTPAKRAFCWETREKRC